MLNDILVHTTIVKRHPLPIKHDLTNQFDAKIDLMT